MLENIYIENILFLDIETVPQHPTFHHASSEEQALWLHKARNLKREEQQTDNDLYERAGIYAEFGKVICISCAYMVKVDGHRQLRVQSFVGDDETILLQDFADMVNKHFDKAKNLLCAHNGKEFDFPYLARRMVINRIPLPLLLDMSGKKPWEIPHLDTMELWKFGDYKNFTPLNLLAYVLGIASPKDDIDGSMIHQVYYTDHNLQRIADYCCKDVITVAQIVLRFKGFKPLSTSEIVFL